MQLSNQQMCTSDNDNQVRGDMIFIRILLMVHCRFADATNFLLCIYNR
jgi:hypothetical protein